MSTSAQNSAAQLRSDASSYRNDVVHVFKPVGAGATRFYHSNVEPAAQQVCSRTRSFGQQVGRDAQTIKQESRRKLEGFESGAENQLNGFEQQAKARSEQQSTSPEAHMKMTLLGKYEASFTSRQAARRAAGEAAAQRAARG